MGEIGTGGEGQEPVEHVSQRRQKALGTAVKAEMAQRLLTAKMLRPGSLSVLARGGESRQQLNDALFCVFPS